MKGATADSNNMGRGYKSIIQYLGLHSVPEGWVQRPKFNDKGDVPGPPIQWQKPEDPDNAQPGYGYIPTDTTNVEDIFFYHSDHLGSTSYITDAKANITQFDAYLPYGELLVDEHSSSEDLPYKFNGKELDQETGLYYYGARYMNPVTSLWYGVDKLMEKHPTLGGYVYSTSNPINFIDPNGKDWIRHNHKYKHDPMVRSQEDVNKTYGDGWEYLFPSGTLFATNGSYSYDLTLAGDIKDTYTGEFIPGEFTTPGGSTLINNKQYLSQYEPSFMERWAQSDNFFAALAYGTLNDMYIGLQAASFGLLQREEWKNPLTGSCFGNLDGSPNYNQTDAIPGIISTIFPVSKSAEGLKLLKKLNAADFSKLFKGTLSRLKPATRGFLNRGMNKGIEKVNNKISTGQVLIDAAGAIQTTKDINEKKSQND